nr:MAG TPA: tail tape measure protein [Bacteriophage sp.]
MADGKITIEVEVNGQKLTSLSASLKKLENDAKKGGEGLKEAGNKIKDSGSKAKKSSRDFKEAGDKVKSTSETVKNSGDGFKQAGDRVKNAGDVAKSGGSGFDEAGNKAKDSGEKAKQGASGFDKIKESIKNFSAGAVGFKLASSAMELISTSLDRAINRFDTLERYPKVMKSLGFSAKDVANSTKQLSDGIEGLPTTLDDVVKTTQKLTSMTGDLKTSTKLTLALNNAFLASGASTEDASRGLQQFTQMLSAGKVDMQSWKTLQETMPYALQKTAESFGFAGQSAQKDFYSALQSGQITFKDFSKRLIELNQGTNGFAEMAKKNSEGIQTSWNNIINAVAKGVANVMKAFDDLSKAVTGKSIAKNLDGLKSVVNGLFKTLSDGIRGVIPVAKAVSGFLGELKPIFDALAPVIMGAVAGALAFKGAMLGLAIVNGVKGLVTGLIQSLLTFISTTTAAEGATLTFSTALSTLSTGGIAVVVGALVGLVSMLSKETEAQKKAREVADKHKESLKKLSDEIEQGKEAYADRQRELKATADENEKLVKRIEELSGVEKKTASQKKELAAAAQTLNDRIAGLNITYDKATGTINMTADAIRKQIAVSKQSAEAEAANQRLVEIAKQKLAVEEKIAEVKNKLKEAEENLNKSLDGTSVKEAALKKAREEANKQINELKGNLKDLESQYDSTAETASRAAEKTAQATEDAAGRQAYSWQTMTEEQRSFVENAKSQFAAMKSEVQNAFQAIEQQAVVSVDQMTANLQSNIDAVEQWASNLEQLAARGLDQGLIEQLRQAGPKAAAQTQALVEASDEQLQALNGKWNEAGDKAKEGFLRGIKATGAELPAEIQAMVTAIGDEFRSALEAAGFEVKGREVPQKIGEGISSGADAVGESARGLKDNLNSALQPMPDEAKQKGAEAGLGVAAGLNEKVWDVTNGAKNIKDQTINQFSLFDVDGMTAGMSFGNGVANGVTSSAQAVVTQSAAMSVATVAEMATLGSKGNESGAGFGRGVADGVTSTFGATKGAAQGTKDGINKEVASLKGDGHQSGNQFGSGVAGGIASQIGSVSSAASSMRTSALSQFAGNYAGGYSAGTAIGEGMSAGIRAMAGAVAAASASIASAALGAAKSALKVNSPSKVFRDQVGKSIPEGWAVGITKYGYYVNDSVKDLSRNIIDSSRKFVSGFNLGIPKPSDLSASVNTSLANRSYALSPDKYRASSNDNLNKVSEFLQNALNVAEEAVKRPIYMILDDGTLVAKIGKPLIDYQNDKLMLDNMMRGVSNG